MIIKNPILQTYVILALLLVGRSGFCGTADIQVKLTTSASEIYFGQPITATVEVTNTGIDDLQLPSPHMAEFNDLLTSDNPDLWFSGGVGITSINGGVPTVILKPGENVTTKIYLSGKSHDHLPITFRMGFKTSTNSPVVWSNPATVRIKNDKNLPIKIEASLKENNMAHIRITNLSGIPQDIGASIGCGYGIGSLISDTPVINIPLAYSAPNCMFMNEEVILKPGQVYEEDRPFNYKRGGPNPASISFRIGVKTIGYNLVWSNPLEVNTVEGSISDGSLLTREPLLNGVIKKYYPDGKLSSAYNYKDGKLDGHCKTYDENGKLQVDSLFSNGQIVSAVNYHPDGSIYSDLKYMKDGLCLGPDSERSPYLQNIRRCAQ